MPRAVQAIPDSVEIDNLTGDVVSLDGLAALDPNEADKTIDLTKYDDSGIIPGASPKARLWQAIVGAYRAGLIDGTADSVAFSTAITSADDLVGGDITIETNALRKGLPGFVNDKTGPQILTVVVASGSAYLDLTFDDGVFAAEGGAIEAADLELVFAQNGGGATAVSISSVKKNDNATEGSATALAGGETVVRVFLDVTGTPDGQETVSISPAANAIKDAAGNLAPDLNSKTANLVA